jgi:3-methyladenine DNA glycosylase AlkD
MADVEALARDATKRLEAAGSPARTAVLTGGYAPTELRVFGASNPDARAVTGHLAKQLRGAAEKDVLALVERLVEGRTMEGRFVAYLLLARHKKLLDGLDAKTIERLGRGNDNWASVDAFACLVSGPAWLRGRLEDATVMRWAESADLWWRRAALASTVPLNQASKGGKGDTRRTLAVCERLVADHEDMVVKAMSWALRSLIGFDRKAVESFVARHESALHRRVLREVRTKLTTGRKYSKRVTPR